MKWKNEKNCKIDSKNEMINVESMSIPFELSSFSCLGNLKEEKDTSISN